MTYDHYRNDLHVDKQFDTLALTLTFLNLMCPGILLVLKINILNEGSFYL